MPCYSPLKGYYARDKTRSGKRAITFDRNASFSGIALKLPCGQCVGCRLEKSRQWAMRCMHEKKMHEDNIFVTLTYDDEHLPSSGSLDKTHLQLFMKRLRKKYGTGIRFYACGEYGDLSKRPHYHAILFNLRFPDSRFYKANGRGENLYTSRSLERIWGNGLCVIGDVSFDSAAYVARYVMKKITGDDAEKHYGGLLPEFCLMSRKPGIGAGWYMKFAHETYAHDSVIVNGVECRPPRYYDNKWSMLDSMGLEELKEKRRRMAVKYRKDNTPDRLRVREVVALAKMKLSQRKV